MGGIAKGIIPRVNPRSDSWTSWIVIGLLLPGKPEKNVTALSRSINFYETSIWPMCNLSEISPPPSPSWYSWNKDSWEKRIEIGKKEFDRISNVVSTRRFFYQMIKTFLNRLTNKPYSHEDGIGWARIILFDYRINREISISSVFSSITFNLLDGYEKYPHKGESIHGTMNSLASKGRPVSIDTFPQLAWSRRNTRK